MSESPREGHVVVVGAGLAGARTAAALRRSGHRGPITLVGAEHHAPYDRPPLSKDLLVGRVEATTIPLDLAQLQVRPMFGVSATGLRCLDRVLVTTAGELPYDGLVMATGASPLRLPGTGEQLTLRTVEEARALRARLVPGARVVIVGAGWIGAEVATAALAADCQVTCLEAGPAPVAEILGAQVGKRLLGWWSEVDLRLNTPVCRVEPGHVLLAGADALPADVVVTGIGVRPAVDWLTGSGLDVDGGVLVDEWLRAAPGVVAVGDVAHWWSRRWNRRMRVEHWDDAAAGAAVAAAALLEPSLIGVAPHDPVPYFWSDQFGHRLQYVGAHAEADPTVWRIRQNGSWSGFWVDHDRRIVAAVVTDLPRENIAARALIGAAARVDLELLSDPEVPLTAVVRQDRY